MHNMRQNKVPISFTNLNYFTTPERFARQSQHQYANQKRARAQFFFTTVASNAKNLFGSQRHEDCKGDISF